jgi:hypothetical protein
MARRDDEDLRALLDDLDERLDALRSELDDEPRRRSDEPRRRSDKARGRRPRPPTAGELVRFTEEHTIPTTVAALEAAVAALELLQGLLGLATREGRAERTGRALEGAGGAAAEGVERTLAELRRALREADLPADPETRDVVADARELTEAVEERVAGSRRAEPGVAIDVDEADDGAGVDVDAELRSLKDDLDQDGT